MYLGDIAVGRASLSGIDGVLLYKRDSHRILRLDFANGAACTNVFVDVLLEIRVVFFCLPSGRVNKSSVIQRLGRVSTDIMVATHDTRGRLVLSPASLYQTLAWNRTGL